MKFTLEKDHNIAIIHLAGEISEQTYGALDRALRELGHQGVARIVLDLGKVTHIHYRIVGQLLARKQDLTRLAGDIKLINVNPYLYDIFRLYGFYPFEIYPTRRAVLKSFSTATS